MKLNLGTCAIVVFGICISRALGLVVQDNKAEESVMDSSNFKFAAAPETSEPIQEQYRTSYYFGGHPRPAQNVLAHYAQAQPQDWNRDTYANAATDLGYSADGSQGYSTSYHVPMPVPSYGGGDDGFDFDGGAGGILGGLGGLAGLLGVKGLKGLGILGLLKLGIIPLLFLILPAIILLPLLLLFIPIPVITIPQGRSFGMDLKELGGKVTTLARSVLDSDQCIERISCEMSRYGRGTYLDKTLKRVIQKYESQMPNSLQRMARAYLESNSPGCKKYGCFLLDDTSSTVTSKKYKKTL